MKSKEELQVIFNKLPDVNPSLNKKEWKGYSALFQYLSVDEIAKLTKKGILESNHAEYDCAEPSYRIKP